MPAYLAHDEPVLIWTGKVMLDGRLTVPENAPAAVVLAGLGGTWHHPGYRAVAARLTDAGFATIVSDLLTPDEQQFDKRTGHFRVDLPFLAHRASDIVQWIERNEATCDLPVAYFGTSAAGSAGLLAVAKGLELFALVLNAARADLLLDQRVSTPCLILVDDNDAAGQIGREDVIRRDGHAVVTVSGSTGLMAPPAALDTIASSTVSWLRDRVPQMALA